MDLNSAHKEIDKKGKEAGALGVTGSLSSVDQEKQSSDTPKPLVQASFLPSFHFTFLEEDNTTENAAVSEKGSSPLSDSTAYGRQQFSPSDFYRPHSVGPDRRRRSVHSKLSLPTPSGLLCPGSAVRPRRRSEGGMRSSRSEPPLDPNMEAPAVTYPLSLTHSRNSIVSSSSGNPLGYGEFIPQEQPGHVSLDSCSMWGLSNIAHV